MGKGNLKKYLSQAKSLPDITTASQYHRSGNWNQAEQAYFSVLKKHPQFAPALRGLGLLYHQTNRIQQAIPAYQQVLSLTPNDAEIHNNLGVAYESQGRLGEAVTAYQNAIALQPNYPQALTNLGNTLHKLGRLDEAAACYRQAIALDPNYPKGHTNLGNVLREQGDLKQAIVHFRQAFVLQPTVLSAHLNLANALQEYGSQPVGSGLEEATSLYRSVLLVQPSAEVYYNLGTALFAQLNDEEAIEAFQQAIHLKPDFVEARNNLGMCFYGLKRLEEAIEQFRSCIQLKPNYAEAHANLGGTLILAGNWSEGFTEYEWRLRRQTATFQPITAIWDGSSLQGKSIVLQSEMGFGDDIHFVRYVPLLYEKGASQVFIQCRESLLRLFETIPKLQPIAQSNLSQVDYCLSMMSLPHRFQTTPETIPKTVPYIKSCSASVQLKHSDHFKIGIVWASESRYLTDQYRSYRQRSCPLSTLFAAIALPEVQLYSLQVGSAAADIQQQGYRDRIIDLSPHITDFAETAAFIDQLDLVITVDTAVAHLAGALGKQVWVMLPYVPDWRWLLDRNDTPWYPTMRLFRQPKPGDWESVVQQIRQELHHSGTGNRSPRK